MTIQKNIADGDRARVLFDPPRIEDGVEIREAEGPVLAVADMRYIQDELHRRAWSMPSILDLSGEDVISVEIVETAAQAAQRRSRDARGEIVFPNLPKTAAEIEDALNLLAEIICRESDRRLFRGRHSQLKKQFADIADLVDLAQTPSLDTNT